MPNIKPNIEALKTYVPGKSAESVRRELGLKSIIKLGSNENPLGCSPMASKAAAAAASEISVYPDGGCSRIRSKIANLHGLALENVMMGNGSDEILLMLAAAYIQPGDHVIVSENTFSLYACDSQIFDAVIDRVPLNAYRYDLNGMLERITNATKLIYICNPNNPTGTYVSGRELSNFLDEVPLNCLVVIDEAYAEFADAPDFPKLNAILEKSQNVLICRTFSKIYGLAGLRIGYALSHPPIIGALHKVKNFNPFNVNRIAQAAASASLSDSKFIQSSLGLVHEGKKVLAEAFDKRGITHLPTQGNFICFSVPKKSAENLSAALVQKGIIIRPLLSFGMPEWCRITIGTTAQIHSFLAALDTVI